MGIFSDRCEALVNPVTGMALTGVALEEAKKVASWPRCGHSVKKGAKFCSKCGASARGGWVKCPTCGEWVGNDSNFCWNCNTPLHPTDGVAIAGGVWARSAGVFAQRFEVNNVKVPDGRDLQVQEGTVAVLMSGGAVEDVLDAGNFNIESTARKINWFGNPPPRSVVLIEAGETVLPLSVKDIPTKAIEGSGLMAGVLVDFYGEVIVRFSGGKTAGVNFVSNVLKDSREIAFADLSKRLIPILERAVKDECANATIKDLVADPQIRVKLRKHMTDIAERELDASGVDLVRVSGAEFNSKAYNEFLHRDAKKAEERMAEEHEIAKKEFEDRVSLGKFKSEKEMLREKAAIEHEFRMDALKRQEQWEQLLRKIEAEKTEARLKREREEREAQLKSEEERERWERQREERRRKEAEEDARFELQKEKAELARKAELEEEQRSKAAAEKVRKQKEEDADRIRMWALLDEEKSRLWTLEDAAHEREWDIEAKKLEHDEFVAKAVIRAGDIKREHDWKVELEAIIHGGECEGRKTDFDLKKAKQVAAGQISVKELWDDYLLAKRKKEDEYENEKIVGKAKAEAAVSGIKRTERKEDHVLEVKETEDWIEVKRKKLFEKRELLEEIKQTTDPAIKEMLIEEYRTNYLVDGNEG